MAPGATEPARRAAAPRKRNLPANIRSRPLASTGPATDRSELRRLLSGPAVLWIGRHGLQLFVAEVWLYPQASSSFRGDLIHLVRNLRLRLSNFPALQQNR